MKTQAADTKMSRFAARTLYAMALLCVVATGGRPLSAQSDSECNGGYRIVAHRWDPVLKMNWELRQDCAHPDWPARSFATSSIGPGPEAFAGLVATKQSASILPPLLVHAGDQVRLWQADGFVRIEMSGVAEQSARNGEHVMVQITRQTDEAGLTVQRIPGIVRGTGNVEMDR